MPENKEQEPQRDLVVPKSAQPKIENALDQIFDANPEDMQTTVEELLQALDQEQDAEVYEPLKLAIESCWCIAQATKCMQFEMDFTRAAELFDRAASGFDQLGKDSLRNLSIGVGAYAKAVLDIKELNLTQANDRFLAVEEYLDKAGEFSRNFKPLIDHMKPEILFAAALPPLLQLDFPTARALIEEASSAAHKVAEKYYSDEDPNKAFFEGMASFYPALSSLIRSVCELQQFDYDCLAADSKLGLDSRTACKLLRQAKEISEPAHMVLCQAEAIDSLQEVIIELADIMKKVFESTFTPKRLAMKELRSKVRCAIRFAEEAGPAAIALARYCEQVDNQIKNLQRLIRPTKKDFGAYSGLVAAGLFLVLLPVVSWANAHFTIGLGAEKLITSCIVLALIAGFGFGAVRFKSLLFPMTQSDDDSG